LVVFNYLIHNGDAHLKNFSLIRNESLIRNVENVRQDEPDDYTSDDYILAPAYDLLNTRLHVPNESRTALSLFKGDYETESYLINGFYAFDDFLELAIRLGLHPGRFQRFMPTAVSKKPAIFSLVDRLLLSAQCQQLYKDHVGDSIRALSYSYANSPRESGSGRRT